MRHPGLTFKTNFVSTPPKKAKPPKKPTIQGRCDWCYRDGYDLLKNQYGLFHHSKKKSCFEQMMKVMFP